MNELDKAIETLEKEWKLYLKYGHKDKNYQMPNMGELTKLRIKREKLNGLL